MGKPKEKVKGSTMILAKELFSNQSCPKCGTFIAIVDMEIYNNEATLFVKCLNEECDYIGERDLI